MYVCLSGKQKVSGIDEDFGIDPAHTHYLHITGAQTVSSGHSTFTEQPTMVAPTTTTTATAVVTTNKRTVIDALSWQIVMYDVGSMERWQQQRRTEGQAPSRRRKHESCTTEKEERKQKKCLEFPTN